MEDSKIAFKASILTEDSIPCFKVICSKCAGSGNFKTPKIREELVWNVLVRVM